MKMGWEYSYPHIPILDGEMKRLLLGRRLFWTEKKDGSNIAFWLEGDKVVISSRNLKEASGDLKELTKKTDEYPKILEVLKDNPNYVVYVEACRKGKSITQIETYDRDFLIVFDIFDRSTGKFLCYTLVHQICFRYGVPVVKLWAKTRHRTIKNLTKWENDALEYCKQNHIEGMVIKTFDVKEEECRYFKEYRKGLIQAKTKVDLPKPVKTKMNKGNPLLPPLPVSEIMGCIDKAWQELGSERFKDVKTAMPLIAKYVNEACKQHYYSNPTGKLYRYWLEYKEKHLSET